MTQPPPTPPNSTRPTPAAFLAPDPVALYRHFDSRGELLYVGITDDPVRRWEQHRETSAWSLWVALTYLSWLLDRPTARRAEVLAIANEAPLFNAHRRMRRTAREDRNRYLLTGVSGLPRRVPCLAITGEFCVSCGPDADTWLDTRLANLMAAS